MDLENKMKGLMMNNNPNWNQTSSVSAFIIGAILFLLIGKSRLAVNSTPIFIAGLIGVAVAVLAFATWNIYFNSNHREN